MTHHLVGLHKVLVTLFDKGIVRIRVLEACCNALYSLGCFKEAAEGFQMIINKLQKTQKSELKHVAQNYLCRSLALKEMKDYEGASSCLTKSLDIRRQLLQENEDAMHGEKMVREIIESLEHCSTMQKTRDGATTGHTEDLKVVFEEIKSVLKSMEKNYDADHVEIAVNYNHLGCCYFLMEDFNAALESFEQAIKIREEHVEDSDGKRVCLFNKGNVCFRMNRNSEAAEAHQSALDVRKLLGMEDHLDTADIYEAIGMNHLLLREFSEALEAFRQCLNLRKKHLGDHVLTAHNFTLIGTVYLQMGEYEAARENCQHAANLAKSLLSDHEVTASKFDQLAKVYLKMGNYTGALDAYQKSRNISLKLLGEHQDTATSFQVVGNTSLVGSFVVAAPHGNEIVREIIVSIWNCLKTPKNLDDASTGHTDDFKAILEELKSVLKSMEQINDVEHAEIATNCNQLGCCYFLMEDYNAALESFEQAIKIREEHVGDSDDKVTCLRNKGVACFKMNRNNAAGKAYQSALDLRKLLGIEDHADTATIYRLLGENFFALEKFDEALDAFRQSLQLRKKHLGDHTLTAQAHANTAAVHFEMGEYKAASENFHHAANLLKLLLGEHEETASAFAQLAATYLEMENYRGAMDALQEVMNIRLKLLGEHLATSFQQFGFKCFTLGDIKEAVRSFRKASELRLDLLGEHLVTARSYQMLGEVQLQNGNFSDALESLQTAFRMKLKKLGFHPESLETFELLGCAYQCAALVGSTQSSLPADQRYN